MQLDVADGTFVSDMSWPCREGQFAELEHVSVLFPPNLLVEVHLMAEEPERLGVLFARAGAKRILGHIEAFQEQKDVERALSHWRGSGAEEVGLALLLSTPREVLDPYIASIDVVQIMSIATLGKQGAPFESSAIARIEELHQKHADLIIEVDGGVGESNIAALVEAGATRFGVGSAIFKAEDPKAAYDNVKALAEAAQK